jgi:hypothetical protein
MFGIFKKQSHPVQRLSLGRAVTPVVCPNRSRAIRLADRAGGITLATSRIRVALMENVMATDL